MTLPTPVFIAGAVACVAAGFLAGVVTSPGGNDQTTAQVESYERQGSRLCLSGEAVEEWDGDLEDGLLCGTWQRTPGVATPEPGDTFRFVAVQTEGNLDGEKQQSTVIYGDVVE